MLNRSHSLTGLALTSPSSRYDSPWCTPVLGDFYKCSRTTKSPFLANLKKVTNLPKAPRPTRTRQIFHSVKNGIRECIQRTEDDLVQLKTSDNHVSYLSITQQIKLAERFRKRLEFHLCKIEELEEKYILHQQLCEGVKSMAKAYTTHTGTSKKSSLHNMDCGLKECLQILCAIEASLENLLGTFDCTFRGLFGFARLMPGDVFEVVLRYGHQKWKSKGKIGVTNQSWDPSVRKFKAVVGDTFSVKAMELKMLGKHVTLGEKNCETLNLFSAKPHDMVISLNPSSSLKLGILVRWNPLEGVEESTLSDISSRIRSSPGRREKPVQSMIEGDGKLEYWSRVSSSQSSSSPDRSQTQNNRYSVPCFPSSFDATSPGMFEGYTFSSTDRPVLNIKDKFEISCESPSKQSPHSMEALYEVPVLKVGRLSSGALDRISEFTSRSNVEEEFLAAEEVKLKWQTFQKSIYAGCRISLSESLQNLKSKLNCLSGRYKVFHELEKEVDSIQQLLQKKSGKGHTRTLSNVSISVESALEAFNFLDSDDYLVEVDKRRHDQFRWNDYELFNKEHCTQSPQSTSKTTDSGIELVASQLDDDDDDELGFESSSLKDALSTGNPQVDIALNWHLQYCSSLVNNINNHEEKTSIEKLQQQAAIISKLARIATNIEQEPDIHQVLSDLTSKEELKQFWLRCVQSHLLFTSTDNFIKQLSKMDISNHIKEKYPISLSEVYISVVGHVLDVGMSRNAGIVELDIITLHQFMQFFNGNQYPSIQDYIQNVALEVQNSAGGIAELTC